MRLLKYLFFKYYHFQVKVGNEDIAPYSAIMFLCFILEFIYADIVCFCYFFIPQLNKSLPSVYSFILLYLIGFVVLFFLLIHKKKYEMILLSYEEEWNNRKNAGVILFTFVPIVLFFMMIFI